MSRAELEQERRETRGSTEQRRLTRQRSAEALGGPLLVSYAGSALVVHRGQRLAIALELRGNGLAPLVREVSLGPRATHLVRTALRNGVALAEAPEVATRLRRVAVGEPLPVDLYSSVARLVSVTRATASSR